MTQFDDLDQMQSYLIARGVALSELPQRESFAVQKQWTSVFGRFAPGTPHKHGEKAVLEYLAEKNAHDMILLFLSSRITAFPISENQRPSLAFRYTGPPVDLSAFHDLEFAICDASYLWTIVHTHEDGSSFGGPYFLRASDL